VWPQLTYRSRGRELGQEGMCNRVRDRYEDKVARTLPQTTRSSRCGFKLCKQHERSNMWYQRELIKNTYSTTAYAGLIARRDLPRFIVYHSDVMWPYYKRFKNLDFLSLAQNKASLRLLQIRVRNKFIVSVTDWLVMTAAWLDHQMRLSPRVRNVHRRLKIFWKSQSKSKRRI
jgi:hypothetical protein